MYLKYRKAIQDAGGVATTITVVKDVQAWATDAFPAGSEITFKRNAPNATKGEERHRNTIHQDIKAGMPDIVKIRIHNKNTKVRTPGTLARRQMNVDKGAAQGLEKIHLGTKVDNKLTNHKERDGTRKTRKENQTGRTRNSRNPEKDTSRKWTKKKGQDQMDNVNLDQNGATKRTPTRKRTTQTAQKTTQERNNDEYYGSPQHKNIKTPKCCSTLNLRG